MVCGAGCGVWGVGFWVRGLGVGSGVRGSGVRFGGRVLGYGAWGMRLEVLNLGCTVRPRPP